MNAISKIRSYAIFAAFLFFIEIVHSLQCYQCISTNNSHPFQCNEFLSSDIDIKPEPCDAVFEAQYCVKHTGRFEGKTISADQITYIGKGNQLRNLALSNEN